MRPHYPRRLVQPLHGIPVGSVGRGHRVRIVLEVLCTYPVMLRALRRTSPAAMVGVARTIGSPAVEIPPTGARCEAERLGAIVGAVLDRLPTDSRCLIQSLVLTRLLARRSIDARVILGVSVDAGFKAHAWVEHEGSPVLPRLRYEPLIDL